MTIKNILLGSLQHNVSKNIFNSYLHKYLFFKPLIEKPEVQENGLMLSKFEKTILLPTYLIAYCIGKFEHVEKTIKNDDGTDILIQCYSPRGRLDSVKNTLEVIITLIIYEFITYI